MAGVFMTNDAVFGAEQTNFAGVSARDVNVQRDGISMNSQRWPNGLDSPTRMNPDLVGEIRLILAPVDAEMGRGNGQVQIQTRSGTNAYHGAAVYNVQNSALDANLWANNRNQTPNAQGKVEATQPPWRNYHDYSLSFGGPIQKNKTFFYALWNQQIIVNRQTVNPTVLTDCARLGIFRYYDNFPNGSARATVPTVNVDGSPRSPDGSPSARLQRIRDPGGRSTEKRLLRRSNQHVHVGPDRISFDPGSEPNAARQNWIHRKHVNLDAACKRFRQPRQPGGNDRFLRNLCAGWSEHGNSSMGAKE
jgi:hypothetical protein